jgi:hypothetical protein
MSEETILGLVILIAVVLGLVIWAVLMSGKRW